MVALRNITSQPDGGSSTTEPSSSDNHTVPTTDEPRSMVSILLQHLSSSTSGFANVTTAGSDITPLSRTTATTATSVGIGNWYNSPEVAVLNGSTATSAILEGISSSPSTVVVPVSELMDCKWGLTPRSYEVVVDWRMEFRWAWLLHTYGFACLFFMLAFYAFFSILNLRAQLSARPYMSSINVFLCLLGSSRAIFLLVDPYDYKGAMPETVSWILFELAFPCLVSAFGLIQLAFLQLTRLQLGPSQLRTKSYVSLVITTHFCFTIAININWSFNRPEFKVFCFISQTVFVVWGIGLCVSFLFGGYKMMRLLRYAPASIFQHSDSSGFENKVVALGMLANCHNLAAMTAAAAAAVPSFMATPKIRITDENEQTYSYVSDNSHVSSSQNLYGANDVTDSPRIGEDEECGNNSSPGRRVTGSAIYTVSEDVAADDADQESTRMLGHEQNEEEEAEEGDINKMNDKMVTTRVRTNYNQRQPQLPRRPITGNNNNKQQQRRERTTKRAPTIAINGGVKANGRPCANGSIKKFAESSLEMNLLPCSPAPRYTCNGVREVKQDLTLMSILNHIAYVNQSADGYQLGMMNKLKSTCKSQVERVLHETYGAAALGFLLCLLELYRIYGPALYVFWRLSPWTWFTFLSIHRLVELAMGCFMANITKQPVNRNQYPYPCHMKHRGAGLYF